MSLTPITTVPDFKAFARANDEEARALAADTPGDFFGPDGLSFRDVFDAINPLNHIPIISDLFSHATGHTASAASRLAGGALFGGPIGLVASLAGILFEEENGHSPTEAVYAALTDDSPTRLAQAGVQAVADAGAAAEAPIQLAALVPPADISSPVASGAENTILDLYGASAASAHDSYQKASLLPYLREVSVSKIL
ncbi:MAG: hypothetical protein SFW64_03395 [Alphaproteobacteria bacterium]|nr:hypothetical protein [Alphaproteobacteria bacterium]